LTFPTMPERITTGSSSSRLRRREELAFDAFDRV
jgi:hypothetical protein